MRRSIAIIVTAAGALTGGCASSPAAPSGVVRIDLDFNNGPQGWTADYSEYPIVMGPREAVAEYRALPAELDSARRGLYILTGGEDVFSSYKGRAAGLRPGTFYHASFQVEFATNTPHGCVGAGSAPPGEGTLVKAGASRTEPIVTPFGGVYVLNVDKGYKSSSGTAALMIGDIANSIECRRETNGEIFRRWEFKTLRSATSTLRVQSAADGSLWLLVGTEQGFFGGIELYYTRFTATLTPE